MVPYCRRSIALRAQHRNFGGAGIFPRPAIQSRTNGRNPNYPFAAVGFNNRDADFAAFCWCSYCSRRKCSRARQGSRCGAACIARAVIENQSEAQNSNRPFAAAWTYIRDADLSAVRLPLTNRWCLRFATSAIIAHGDFRKSLQTRGELASGKNTAVQPRDRLLKRSDDRVEPERKILIS